MSPPVPAPLAELLARIFVAGSFVSDAVRAAEEALLAGVDTPALRIVAGLEAHTRPSELAALGERLLREFGLSRPSRRALIEALARTHARAFLAGDLEASAFAETLYGLSRRDSDPTEGHHPWCQLQDDISLAADGDGDPRVAHEALRREAERLVGGEPPR